MFLDDISVKQQEVHIRLVGEEALVFFDRVVVFIVAQPRAHFHVQDLEGAALAYLPGDFIKKVGGFPVFSFAHQLADIGQFFQPFVVGSDLRGLVVKHTGQLQVDPVQGFGKVFTGGINKHIGHFHVFARARQFEVVVIQTAVVVEPEQEMMHFVFFVLFHQRIGGFVGKALFHRGAHVHPAVQSPFKIPRVLPGGNIGPFDQAVPIDGIVEKLCFPFIDRCFQFTGKVFHFFGAEGFCFLFAGIEEEQAEQPAEKQGSCGNGKMHSRDLQRK